MKFLNKLLALSHGKVRVILFRIVTLKLMLAENFIKKVLQ